MKPTVNSLFLLDSVSYLKSLLRPSKEGYKRIKPEDSEEEFWHFDTIKNMHEPYFIKAYCRYVKKGYLLINREKT